MINGLRIALFIAGCCLASVPARAGHKLVADLTFAGMCDASAGVTLGSNLIAVANDEDNLLRVYRAEEGGAPIQNMDVSRFVAAAGKSPETDLEGAAWLGDRIYWIGSHSRNREGKYREPRHVFFATKVEPAASGPRLVLAGACYRDLLLDLVSDARLQPFGLLAASTRPPKTRDALNIEGLSATPDGHLLLGFRNPIPKGRALLVPLLNPAEVVAGRRARLGDPVLLDLGGLGVRDLGLWSDRNYILAGPWDSEKKFRLFTWKGGGDKPKKVTDLDFPKHFTPEALVFHPGREEFQILSDDGTLKIQGLDCKRSPPEQRRFRGMWVKP
ncbi:MAG: DUF3616 domain-containing protein [Verrucomicrobia bacterium]|nr:DUF3616 domain-containing protein [Verrucomicrobiota bacterium]